MQVDWNDPLLFWEDMNENASKDGYMSLKVIVNFNPNFCLAHSETICRIRLSRFHKDQTLFDAKVSIPTEDPLYYVLRIDLPIASAKVGERLRIELSSTKGDFTYDVWRPLILSKSNS